ncbi:MAG TPA: precorrin-3B C(17)-methyltransferase [Acidimicrobiales bacterium]|nr:precorrin-3B C(17)-methyltransferase [Acidimicrobiales bacterium]
MAAQLPFETVHGRAGDVVRERWRDISGFVLFLAVGAATRIVAPLLGDKATDPAVVCVDEAGRFAVAVCGGHAAGANDLALQVAEILGAEPVITTATDATGLPALDRLPGLTVRGDVAGVTAAWLNGALPTAANPLGWPAPAWLGNDLSGSTAVTITDRVAAPAKGHVTLHPPSLVAGIGASAGAPAPEVAGLLAQALADAGLAPESLAEVATLDRKAAEPAITALGLPVRSFVAGALAAVDVPSPSAIVAAAVGTPSVCEAAALLAAGEGAELVVAKRASAHGTVAIARRRRPRGHISLVGLGPGTPIHRTPAAAMAIRRADVVVGYAPYLAQCADLINAAQESVTSPIGDEVVRAKQAVTEASTGRRVAVVCSGDSGVYGMASIAFEVAATEAAPVDIEVVPGVTAALATAALLGAPLGHDHAIISLSDLLTPWISIVRRLRAAAEADLVIAMYNPRSNGRQWQLPAACSILLEHRVPSTPVGIVTAAGRPDENVTITTLGDFDPTTVGMTTCVIIGSSTTRILAGHMVTPRGYDP